MENWEIDNKINCHPVIQMLQHRLPELNDAINGLMPDRNMIHQMRNEIGYDSAITHDKSHPNGYIYQRLVMMESRMTNVEVLLSTIEKAFLCLQGQLGYAETLRVPDPSPIEERLDEDGPD